MQKHQQDRMALVNALSSLRLQKQHEDAELQELQETKVKVRLMQLAWLSNRTPIKLPLLKL